MISNQQFKTEYICFDHEYICFYFIDILLKTLLQQAGRSLNQKDGEVKDSQFRIASLSEEVARLKKLVEVTQVGCTLVCGACINKLCLASVSSSRKLFRLVGVCFKPTLMFVAQAELRSRP